MDIDGNKCLSENIEIDESNHSFVILPNSELLPAVAFDTISGGQGASPNSTGPRSVRLHENSPGSPPRLPLDVLLSLDVESVFDVLTDYARATVGLPLRY